MSCGRGKGLTTSSVPAFPPWTPSSTRASRATGAPRRQVTLPSFARPACERRRHSADNTQQRAGGRMHDQSSTTHLTSRNVRKRRTVRTVLATVIALAAGTVTTVIATQGAEAAVPFPVENLDGSQNNVANPTWG